jgi:glycosyltransferase involved in cell wall biosynthesis/peptidoglycan/xylan/chitin deacetylase (PgdA/CDA1 family)
MDHPSFSIVIPTFQRREIVCDALRSLTALDYRGDVEIVIVIDGSTDGTGEALAEIASPSPIRIVEQANRGASGARNRGASEASGDIILFLDDDMISDPGLLEQHAKMYRDGADAVIGRTPLHPNSAPGFLADSTSRWIETQKMPSPLSVWDIFTGQLSVRRKVFEEIGGFDEAFTTGPVFANEDADLGARLLARFDVRYNPDAISRQRYFVTPREYMDRASKLLEGDLHFLKKHPQYSREVLNARGMGNRLGRYLLVPLSRSALLSKFLATSSVWAAELALATPFRSNRILARYYSGSRTVAFWAALRERLQLPGRERLLVLCYHAIRDRSDDPVLAPYGIPPQAFAQQLDHLSSAGFTFVGADAVANFVQHGAPLPKRPVLLTFDDCYEELVEIARDVLQPRRIPALAFAVTGTKSGTNEWDQAFGAGRQRLLAPVELKALASLGFEIGSHSRSHRDMTTLDEAQQSKEAAGSAADLVALGLPAPRFFAYPFGAVDVRSQKAVQSAGYVAAFGCRADYATRKSNPLHLPRVLVFASDVRWRFRAKSRWPRKFEALATRLHATKTRVGKVGRRVVGGR